MGWLIGRVLFAVPPHDGTGGDHPSPVAVADNLQQPTRELGRTALERSLSGLAPGGVCLATGSPPRWWSLAPPFHPYLRSEERRRSVFCGTDPAGCPGWVLPTTSSCGARTFLDTSQLPLGDAVARPAIRGFRIGVLPPFRRAEVRIRRSSRGCQGLLHVGVVVGRPSRARRGRSRAAPSHATT